MANEATPVTEEEALLFHANGKAGKIEISPTKPLTTQRDLSLAYSPGVAWPCLHIARNPSLAYDYTSKGNLVAVISNGTAVLGLGDLGALASKPVMEGKAVLFKRFADVDSIDLEVDTRNVDEFVNSVRFLGPSFGGINLEDIKAPECFIIEQRLRELLDIPVFHDDQHGTAIVAAAGLLNALDLTGRDIRNVWTTSAALSEVAAQRRAGSSTRLLVRDLEVRDLLDRTLIALGTEFGRPAGFDGGGGRGHHSKCFSLVLAGGGLRTGQAIGTTDDLGMAVVSDPVSIPDYHATIHAALGTHPALELHAGDRPVPLTDGGVPIARLFA